MDIYFDNAASTPVCPEAARASQEAVAELYGNPSSGHGPGRFAEAGLKAARLSVAGLLHAGQEDVVFTSGGTESNNLAIFGAAKRPGSRIITSAAEHPSVLDAFKTLAERGFDVVILKPDTQGVIDPAALCDAINDNTVLMSLSHINHETGAITDVAALGGLIKKKNPGVIFHVDAVQSFGKHPVDAVSWPVDLISVSAHKIHGTKGVGALYVEREKRVGLRPVLYGGGQQYGLRPGTENLPGICALGSAAQAAAGSMKEDYARVSAIKEKLLRFAEETEGVLINGPIHGSPYIVNMSFEGIPSEVMQNALDERGIYVSAGAACNTRKSASQNVPFAYGLGKERAGQAIRVSLGRYNTPEEGDAFVDAAKGLMQSLRGRRV